MRTQCAFCNEPAKQPQQFMADRQVTCKCFFTMRLRYDLYANAKLCNFVVRKVLERLVAAYFAPTSIFAGVILGKPLVQFGWNQHIIKWAIPTNCPKIASELRQNRPVHATLPMTDGDWLL